MTTKFWVELTNGGDGTPSEGEVCWIGVVECARYRAEVECCAWEDAVAEVTLEARVVLVQGSEVVDVITI